MNPEKLSESLTRFNNGIVWIGIHLEEAITAHRRFLDSASRDDLDEAADAIQDAGTALTTLLKSDDMELFESVSRREVV